MLNKLIILCIILLAFFLFFNKKSVSKSRQPAKDNLGNKVEIISYSGEYVTLSANAVKGGITVFDFYADWCGPCQNLSSQLDPYVKSSKGVYIRKINIKNWDSPVAKAYNIESIPSVWIYNQNGEEVSTRLNGFEKIKEAVEKL